MGKTKLSVCGVLMHQKRFLIVKRSEKDDFLPNCWEFPGGGVEEGETVEDALCRELKEELGFDIAAEKAELVGISEEFTDNDKSNRYLQLNYVIVSTETPEIKLSSEHVAYDWAEADDVRLDDFLKNIVAEVNKSDSRKGE